jgi:hypothetical protein
MIEELLNIKPLEEEEIFYFQWDLRILDLPLY